jgi:hypothetical protein
MLRTLVLTTLCVSVVGAEAPAPAPSPWQYIHPDAAVIGGVEWHKASESPFLRDLKRELGPSLKFTTKGDAGMSDALEAIYFSAADVPDGTDMKDTRGVALVRMRTTLEPLIRAAMKGKARRQNYNGIYVLIPERDNEWRVAILDDRHALMGDWPSLRAVLNRKSQPEDTPLLIRARQLAATTDLWVVVNDPGKSVQKNPMLAEVRGVDAALSLGARAELVVQLATDAPEKAAALATALHMMSSTLPSRPKSLNISSVDSLVRITASSTASEVTTAFSAFGDRFKTAAGTAPGQPRPVAMRQPEPPPEKQIIRIYGLEEGVREIPLKR